MVQCCVLCMWDVCSNIVIGLSVLDTVVMLFVMYLLTYVLITSDWNMSVLDIHVSVVC